MFFFFKIKFIYFEKIRYNTFGRKALVWLDTGNSYYARVINPHTIKLHKSTSDALAGINTVFFTDYGSGTHSFESISGKLVLNSIVITDPGSGYENKQRTCDSVGVNTALDTINIKDHDYKSGEIIQYSPDLGSTSVAIAGSYFYMFSIVVSVYADNLQFALSEIMILQAGFTIIFLIFVGATTFYHIYSKKSPEYPDLSLMILNAVAYYILSVAFLDVQQLGC